MWSDEGVDERIVEVVLHSFGHVERMESDRRVYVECVLVVTQ